MEGVVGKVCERLDIPYFSCRGYTSMTAMWENAQRLKRLAERDIIPVILHLGDHDPSGIDMSRDIQERVEMFMDGYGDKLEFHRLALNKPQIIMYNPPENPAKSTDTRYQTYVDEHGDKSWELDALDPSVIDGIIDAAVAPYRNDKQFKKIVKREQTEKDLLQKTSDRWGEVVDLLEGY